MPFMIIHALLHMTALAIVAFFILFAASRAEGFVALLGRLLGYWLLLLALVALVFGIFHAVTGHRDGPGWMMHRGWHHMGPPGPWGDHPPPPGSDGQPPSSDNSATPAKPTEPKATPGKPG